jgi:hypothetical protein
MKFGYYTAHSRERHGNPRLSHMAESHWRSLGVPDSVVCPWAGVTFIAKSDGTMVARIILHDWFTGTLKIFHHDIKQPTEEST